ncbi:hypothetical protein B0T13DRAFT_461992 [Neurospora crassa]|nr:hypothetical protein B0T13DRAFT_461992 [Neurospora crassa]
MTRKEYYTHCACPAGKLSAPGWPEYLVVHIHLPPRDNSDDFLPPHHAEMERKNPGVLCQCLTERSRLPGRPDLIGVHFHGLSPKSTEIGESSTLPDDTTKSNTCEEGSFCWAVSVEVQEPQDPQNLGNVEIMLALAAAGVAIGFGAAVMFFPPIIAASPSGAVSTAFLVWKMAKAAKGGSASIVPLAIVGQAGLRAI